MSLANPLASWVQLQTLYLRQLAELGQPSVNLSRVTALAAEAEALLVRLSSPDAMRAAAQDPQAARSLGAAAAQAHILLKRSAAALTAVRERLLSRAQRTERFSAATMAYRSKGTRNAARYLDQRR